jgi:hypothetical protein
MTRARTPHRLWLILDQQRRIDDYETRPRRQATSPVLSNAPSRRNCRPVPICPRRRWLTNARTSSRRPAGSPAHSPPINSCTSGLSAGEFLLHERGSGCRGSEISKDARAPGLQERRQIHTMYCSARASRWTQPAVGIAASRSRRAEWSTDNALPTTSTYRVFLKLPKTEGTRLLSYWVQLIRQVCVAVLTAWRTLPECQPESAKSHPTKPLRVVLDRGF